MLDPLVVSLPNPTMRQENHGAATVPRPFQPGLWPSAPLRALPRDRRQGGVAVNGGFVEVLPDEVRVLSNMVEKADEIDRQSRFLPASRFVSMGFATFE